jgi:glycyl-tRNA synthetase beta chain
LYAGTVRVGDEVEGLLSGEHYIDALTGIANLRETVDRLFDTVLVMADDMELRRNRLALLCMVAGLFDGIADFSKVVANG